MDAIRGIRRRTAAGLGLLGVLALGAGASADVVELTNGAILQGKVLPGQTTEEGLAVELYDTGGVVLVHWDHVLPARAKELRVQTGLEFADEETILVPGHKVLLVTNEWMSGLATNADAKGEPLKLKSATGVREFDRTQVAKIESAKLDGLLVYAPEELYQWLRDRSPPDSAAAHMDLGVKAMQIGALPRAREHLSAARGDAAFAQTTEGRKLEALFRELELREKSAGAEAMRRKIQSSMQQNRWNEAIAQLDQLDKEFKDESVRKAIRFELLKNRVEKGRLDYFKREVQRRVYSTMAKLVEAKAREKKPTREDPDQPRGMATPGTLASARQWCSRDLPTQIWEKIQTDLGLTPEETDAFWKKRLETGADRAAQRATYGTGSFIVVKRPAPTSKAGDQERRRRPPGSTRNDDSGRGPKVPPKEDRPKTEEEWWEAISSSDRARWLTAFFVESSGLFDILRADESELCSGCGGTGTLVSNNSDGSTSTTICTTCNGGAKIRTVTYR
jgi:hypothetical protein